ncbi:hypothetical protein BT69DRAFT_1293652 [Atractiella rhizophila]|nr:hypothetical protein BT69DRAFT_1293652 [Atractiella rhizophila]
MDDVRLLLLRPFALQAKDSENKGDFLSSLLGAITRALSWSLAFYFKSPIRLFRPVKSGRKLTKINKEVSSWTAVQRLAEDQGKDVSLGTVRSLWRKEGWKFVPRHLLPPIVVNTAIGLVLFGTYTSSTTYLSTLTSLSPTTTAFLSGGLAGACQSLISIPIDNVRTHLRSSTYKSWISLVVETFKPSAPVPRVSEHSEGRMKGTSTRALFRQYAHTGFSMGGLSVCKDTLGFALFFSIFESFRSLGSQAASYIDPDAKETRGRRKPLAIAAQASTILLGGTLAGSSFVLVSKPFERARGVVARRREEWAVRSSGSGTMERRPTVSGALRNETSLKGWKWLFKGGVGRRTRIWSVVPPYAFGFLVYAVVSGDLQP